MVKEVFMAEIVELCKLTFDLVYAGLHVVITWYPHKIISRKLAFSVLYWTKQYLLWNFHCFVFEVSSIDFQFRELSLFECYLVRC